MRTHRLAIIQYAIILAVALVAAILHPAAAAPGQLGVKPAYDVAHEITVKGTVAKLVTEQASGSLLGAHLLVNTAVGQLDVHLGPHALKDAASLGLAPGDSVEIIGAPASPESSSVLLARILTTSTRVMVLRNEHGIPVAPPEMRGTAAPQVARGGR
jgi:hypothetical protein